MGGGTSSINTISDYSEKLGLAQVIFRGGEVGKGTTSEGYPFKFRISFI
jgi:hypothetical protein